MIQSFAPTNFRNDRDKEALYEQLQVTFESVYRRDLLLVMGDLNAKVGSVNVSFEGQWVEKDAECRMTMERGW